MKNKIISTHRITGTSIFIFITALFFLYSCNKEEESIPASELESVNEEIILVPKTLATIKLSNNVDLVFRSELDGVVMEAKGNTDNYNGLGGLKALSSLEIFLALTDNDVEVPGDLLLIEENQKVKIRAQERNIIEKHNKILAAKDSQILQKFEGSYCVGSANYNTYDQSGKYYRIYNNYNAGAAGTTFYSSGKQGASKCKRLELEITNCNANSSIKVRTYYKNVFGNYKIKKTINVAPHTCSTYRKTFPSKRYRRTSISSSGNLNNHRFGGYLLYTRY
ncbi:hypothetical protein ATO12_23310 [Aquimarina atlantica]|uniref:Lipoprotein n=1 Tax=Aquimarina atlantica TaxID=1317122 RepID=A0A023BRC1_9FLAO|nr:hypothetical protein [Aquimarina atlantica]EZH72383.1 hypothetical protein ATO12_23310 [Aquimarina atlantica]